MTFQEGVLSNTGPAHKKPLILCLHGGGTNATLFNIQTIRIQRHLSKHFEFVFPDGPFESAPGPGVLPTFEGCEPFYSWVNEHRGHLHPESRAVIEKTIQGRESEFVGVLGFSQGARLGAGLLLEQQLRRKGRVEDGDGEGGFKFGVFLMGTCPPLISQGYTEEQENERIVIPSIHFLGTEDPYCEEGRKLFNNHFDTSCSSLTELVVGHRLPVVDGDTIKIVDEIKALYLETTGQALLDLGAK